MNGEFVDTNIFVYAYDRSAGEKHAKAVVLLDRLWGENAGCTSVQVLQEFFVVATGKTAAPLRPGRVKSIIADLAAWNVHCPTVEDVLSAVDIAVKSRISFWDGMIVRSAAALSASVLWTEDLKDRGKIGGVPIRDPFRDDRPRTGMTGR